VNPSLLDRLVCPLTGGPLRLVPFETEEVACGDGPLTRVREGALVSDQAQVWYPVSRFVPVLLAFSTPFHERFRREHAAALQALAAYRTPDGPCEEGERNVQQTFTEEWNLTQENELSFARTHEDLVTLNREVWLPWLREAAQPRAVLDVGCGIGKETLALREVTGAPVLIGVDLNFALLQAGPRYKQIPSMHFVIASLYHLPFRQEAFDLVYCQGVLHHTRSTAEGFSRLAPFVAPGGHLFIWVYGLEDHLIFRGRATSSPRAALKHLLRRFMIALESVLRPVLARLPATLRGAAIGLMTALAHPLMRRRVRQRALWTRANTAHSLRDAMTPRYAHRHGFNEVVEWFETGGFRIVAVQSAGAHMRAFGGKRIFGIGMTGRRVAAHQADS